MPCALWVLYVSSVYSRGVRFFQRHVVPIQFAFTPSSGGKPHYALITSFLVSVRGVWLLLTAGHCIDDVQENLDRGCSLTCWLVDCAGAGAKHREMLPFDWKGAEPARLFKDSNIDIGVVWVPELIRAALAANKVEPFTEEAWDHDPPSPVEAYLMMGIPAELAKPASPISSLTPVALLVVPADSQPPEMDNELPGRWYGHVDVVPGLSDITGMSGGPILAVARGSDGSQRYWLFAMQSAWHRQSRAIAAWPTRSALQALAELIEDSAASSSEPPAPGGA